MINFTKHGFLALSLLVISNAVAMNESSQKPMESQSVVNKIYVHPVEIAAYNDLDVRVIEADANSLDTSIKNLTDDIIKIETAIKTIWQDCYNKKIQPIIYNNPNIDDQTVLNAKTSCQKNVSFQEDRKRKKEQEKEERSVVYAQLTKLINVKKQLIAEEQRKLEQQKDKKNN